MPPRAFERPAAIALPGDAGLALEGLHVPVPETPRAGAVIAPPHPLYGGSMESPVVTELAHACADTGIESLRFNWRGVGASAGAPSGDPEDADEDYSAALAFVADSVEAPLVACGYSFGAAAAARAGVRHPRVRRLVLVAPPPSMLDADALRGFRGEVWIATGAHDRIAPPAPLEALCAELARARFTLVEDADHFFGVGLRDLGRAATEVLRA